MTANLPSSNLNVRNWYKHHELGTKEQIHDLKNELKTNHKIIDQLLKSISSLTKSELESKSNIIHKLRDQTNDKGNKNSMRRQNDINTKIDTADNKSNEKDSFDSIKKIKEHAERNKANTSQNNIESRDVKLKTKKRNKLRVEILGDSMLNELNRNADINIKIRKYPGESSNDILDYIKPSLRKEPDQT